MHIIFDTLNLYYLPQYMPVYKELLKANHTAEFLFYDGIHNDIIEKIVSDNNLSAHWVNSVEEAIDFYESQTNVDWVFFANSFKYLDRLHKVTKSVQLGHGIGPKSSYYTKSDTPMTVRFVEGNERKKRFDSMYPNDVFVDVGFSKLDPIINGDFDKLELVKYGLDPNKKTILYAPTFYPSSIECFPKNWPEDFSKYNVIIKPHYFSMSKVKYRAQQNLLQHWSSFNNVYLAEVEDYSLVPFLAASDLLISDASSALFEFSVLNKPVVWCDFLKLRWSYRGPLYFRFKKRMDKDYGEFSDIAAHVAKYKYLLDTVEQHLEQPDILEDTRLKFKERLAGRVDGKASKRIIEYLVSNNN